MQDKTYLEQKSPLMYQIMLGMALIFFVYLFPRYLAILIGKESLFSKSLIVLFLALLNIFWFFSFYYLVLMIFSSRKMSRTEIKKGQYEIQPLVALLYVTRNDFKERAVNSCLKQDYPHFHLFILDDSTEPEYLNRIDDFVKKNDNVTVKRRQDRTGFKAGNLNYGLKDLPPEYTFFAVVDADEVIPENFISGLIGYMKNNEKLAFVQANHRTHPVQETQFAGDMSYANNIHWKYMIPCRNKFGFVMFYGHGALFRRSALESVGGFPEVVSEDISLSVILREQGYYGYTDLDIICYEDTPVDYLHYRKRHEKWVRGTAEFMKKFAARFLRSSRIPWFEKIDILFLNLSFLTTVPFFFFLLLCAFILPVFLSIRQGVMITVPWLDQGYVVYSYFDSSQRFSGFWSWDFFIIVVVALFIPYVPVYLEMKGNLKKFVGYLKKSYSVNMGLILITFIGFWGSVFSSQAYFAATADEKDERSNLGFLQKYVAEEKGIFLAELLLGCLLLVVFAFTLNIWLLPVAMSFIMSYLLSRFSWEKKIIQYNMYIPFLTLLIIILFVVMFLISSDFSNMFSPRQFMSI